MVNKAFTLIELIFSIVVLSIAFLAIPQLFEISSANIEEILKDEATFQGIKTAKTIQTYFWDENSPNNDGNFTYILDVQAGDSELDRYNATQYRIGNYILAKKRRFYDNPTFASTTLGSEATDTVYNDIDDFNNKIENITSSLVDLKVKTKIYYINDSANYSAHTINKTISASPQSQSTNIKMIDINITDSKNKSILVYRTISCNIGSAPIKYRTLR